MTRRLIVNADDFGDTPGVNAAVIRAYREGILRFASLMVDRPAAREAALLAKENPGLGVGLHLELTASAPVLAGLRHFFDARARAGLEGEIRRQIERLLSMGVEPTHVDGHINAHAHPVVFPALCRLAKEYGIPRVRLPGGEWPVLRRYAAGAAAGAAPLAAVFGALSRLRRHAGDSLSCPPSWGLLRSGLMSEDYTLWLLANLPEGPTELYFHPTTDPALRAAAAPTPSHQSVQELETLLSPRVKAALAERGIELVSAR